jgi:hypothetical protein
MASKPMGSSVDVPVDDSRDAVFNQRHVEVNQQAKPLVGKPEISQKLLLVD